MGRRELDVIVPVWRHGREALPTVRSIRDAAAACGDRLGVRVLIAANTRCITHLPQALASVAEVIALEDAQRDALVRHALDITRADVVGVVDAGDVVDVSWLSAACDLSDGEVLRPETVVTFGARTGVAHQLSARPSDAILCDLAHRDLWAGGFLGGRADLAAAVASAPALVGDTEWAAAFVGAGLTQTVAARSVVFVRRWSAEHPFLRTGPLLDRVPLMVSPELASVAAPLHPRPDAAIRAWIDRLTPLVRPWRAPLHALRRRVVRRLGAGPTLPPALDAAWKRANAVEALIPFPRPDVAEWIERWAPPDASGRRELSAYWEIVRCLGTRVDYLFFVPWLRTGGADSVVLQYLDGIRRADPEGRIALITTEPIASTRLAELGDQIVSIELEPFLSAGVHRDAFVGWIVPQLIAQYAPHTVHAFNSTVAFDVVERFGASLAPRTRLFLSTFAIDRSHDGEALSVLLLRSPDFLRHVTRVLVDSERFVDRVVEELGYERSKFAVQRSVVEGRAADGPTAGTLRVLWAGRFDIPKRLDVLAAVAEAARARDLPAEFHFYGLEVMGDPGLAETLMRLERAGAIRHAPFATFHDILGEGFGAYVLTSEWEGIPLTLLEAMTAGIPAVAPLVGGVGEVLTAGTGYPVERFDDVEAYVSVLEQILADPQEAARRSARARQLMEESFSASAFDARLRSLDGYLRAQ